MELRLRWLCFGEVTQRDLPGRPIDVLRQGVAQTAKQGGAKRTRLLSGLRSTQAPPKECLGRTARDRSQRLASRLRTALDRYEHAFDSLPYAPALPPARDSSSLAVVEDSAVVDSTGVPAMVSIHWWPRGSRSS